MRICYTWVWLYLQNVATAAGHIMAENTHVIIPAKCDGWPHCGTAHQYKIPASFELISSSFWAVFVASSAHDQRSFGDRWLSWRMPGQNVFCILHALEYFSSAFQSFTGKYWWILALGTARRTIPFERKDLSCFARQRSHVPRDGQVLQPRVKNLFLENGVFWG